MANRHDFMWAVLVHLGTNFWYDTTDEGHEAFTNLWEIPGSDKMRLDKEVWDEYMLYLKNSGVNTLVIDIGDGVIYDSHPELAIEGSWTKDELRAELKKLDEMGFEVIPKLNFSSCHDIWMKEYSRMLSTSVYYKVCEDLINEVCELFDSRIFHIGFDEEDYHNQRNYGYAVIRQNELWWHDLKYIISLVEKNNYRAMMWTDYMRHQPEKFIENCPKSVIACNWYYGNEFDFNGEELSNDAEIRLRPFEMLEKAGFDQFPGGSSCYFDENFALLTDYCKQKISKEHHLGMLQTSWASVTHKEWNAVKKAADLTALTVKKYSE